MFMEALCARCRTHDGFYAGEDQAFGRSEYGIGGATISTVLQGGLARHAWSQKEKPIYPQKTEA